MVELKVFIYTLFISKN